MAFKDLWKNVNGTDRTKRHIELTPTELTAYGPKGKASRTHDKLSQQEFDVLQAVIGAVDDSMEDANGGDFEGVTFTLSDVANKLSTNVQKSGFPKGLDPEFDDEGKPIRLPSTEQMREAGAFGTRVPNTPKVRAMVRKILGRLQRRGLLDQTGPNTYQLTLLGGITGSQAW